MTLQAIRQKYGINDAGLLQDVLLTWCCGCCTLIQEYNEIGAREGLKDGAVLGDVKAAAGTTGKEFKKYTEVRPWLDAACICVVDTPQYQRLRGIKQLGTAFLVFPQAVHTRFEHSLGTAWLAQEQADHLYDRQRDELDMEAEDVRVVALAGLTHDLGHGPFSHTWEEFMRRKERAATSAAGGAEAGGSAQPEGGGSWSHEAMSSRVLEYLVDRDHVEGVSGEDIRRVSDLVRGEPRPHSDVGRRYLYDIVHNKTCGVEVDKMDYLQRDALMCGVTVCRDFKRLRELSKVVGEHIGFRWSEYGLLLELFHAREYLHRTVYAHRAIKAGELMLLDILAEADAALGFSEGADQPQRLCRLKDSLLDYIEDYDIDTGCLYGRIKAAPLPAAVAAAPLSRCLDGGCESRLAAAQALLRRLRRRDLYRLGGQVNVPLGILMDGRWQRMAAEFTAEEVASCYDGGGAGVSLRPRDLIVSQTKIDFTRGGSNPLDKVLFFDHWSDTEGRYIQPNQVERILRVYTRHRDAALEAAAGAALEGWCRRHFGCGAPAMASPAKSPPSSPPPQLRPRTAAKAAAVTGGDSPLGRPLLVPLPLPREEAVRAADPRRGSPAGHAAVPLAVTSTPEATADAARHEAAPGTAAAAASKASGQDEGLLPPQSLEPVLAKMEV
ncbi:hypothetical protein GPECTOR_279g734 [Gonium pectorale]|uniref:HD/PDEase domain-containing protein n=1 Tax=Gonium pectorale TaxID=33097 RepID=A0A150FW20_GONPE|nr:hypothetical protein GPECTOR_279g734 [Gonium pectorale]|eukprot:KXZ41799.1 hypothetical protein GPECTOR_279g734 [Gonium pectorale]